MKTLELAALAKQASRQVRTLSDEVRTGVLNLFAEQLLSRKAEILEANAEDLRAAEENGMSQAFLDRLRLTSARIDGIAQGVREIAAMEDPLHRVLEERTLSCGVYLKKLTVPMGVIGIIFESRPNVSADCARAS